MIRKYKMSEEEILKIWEEFYAKHPDGFMSKESFLATKEVIDTDRYSTVVPAVEKQLEWIWGEWISRWGEA